MTASPFPSDMGFSQIVQENTTNIFNASVTAIKNSGEAGIVKTFAFGILPLFLAFITYNKTKSMAGTSLVLLLSTYLMHTFDLLTLYVSVPLYVLTVFLLGLAIAARFWNK